VIQRSSRLLGVQEDKAGWIAAQKAVLKTTAAGKGVDVSRSGAAQQAKSSSDSRARSVRSGYLLRRPPCESVPSI
jgi:hypothetical protein